MDPVTQVEAKDAGAIEVGGGSNTADAGGTSIPERGPDPADAGMDAGMVGTDTPAISKCIGVNLQPVWDPTDPSQGWGQSTYDAIRQKGFTCLRFILFWDMFEPKKGAFTEGAFTALKNAFDRAAKANLKVIVTAVHPSGDQSQVPAWARARDSMAAVKTNGIPYLTEIAKRFAHHPALGAYDPINEPGRDPINMASLFADYTQIIDAIRAVDPVTPIVLEPIWGDGLPSANDFKSLTPKNRLNLIWSVHDYYLGGHGADYGADGAPLDGEGASNGTSGYVPSAQHKADLAAHVQASVDAAKAQGMALWMGEFGIGNNAAGRDAYIEAKVEIYKARGVGYCWWEYYGSGSFSMVSGEGGAWYPWVSKLF